MSYFQRRGFLPRTILFILRFLGLKKEYSRRNKESDLEQGGNERVTFTACYNRVLTKEEKEAEFAKFSNSFKAIGVGEKIKLKLK